MSDNVVSLDGCAVPEAGQCSAAILEMLDDFRQRVIDGRVVALTVSGVRNDGGVAYASVWGPGRYALPLLGAVSVSHGFLGEQLESAMVDDDG